MSADRRVGGDLHLSTFFVTPVAVSPPHPHPPYVVVFPVVLRSQELLVHLSSSTLSSLH